MIRNWLKGEQHIHWKLNSANCSFWRENWTGEGHLAQFSSNNHRIKTKKVADFWVKGQWNYQMLVHQAPPRQLAYILAIPVPQHPYSDQAYWKINPNGMFTCASALNEIRDKRPKDQFKDLILHKHSPFKASFII